MPPRYCQILFLFVIAFVFTSLFMKPFAKYVNISNA